MEYKRITRASILMGIVIILTILNIGSAYAAGIVTTNISTITPTNLVNNLLAVGGGGITVTNITVNGVSDSIGTFNGGTGIIGFESGIILSSGDIKNVIGPNKLGSITAINNWPGDVDLDALIPGYNTYDASILEFDFIPITNQFQFKYVFSSDEYNEFVGSTFNDVFGFFVNGKNIAMIPGTATPVSINNVNCGNPYNSAKCTSGGNYRNNDITGGLGLNTEMDGLTNVFTATANVIAGKSNHIKIAIADAGDSSFDSNVFIEAGSFASPQLKLSPELSTNNVGETHTLTATLLDGTGTPVSGQTIAFEIIAGPHITKYGTGTTDSKGNAIWSYVGTTVGKDTIVATGYDQTSIYVYETWQQSSLTVNLTPITAINPLGTEHTITATVKNSSGGPAVNEKVNFSIISGPNSPLSGSGTTNSKGQVTFIYTGSGGIGIDKIQASVAKNGNITYSNTIQKEWVTSGDILAYYRGLNKFPNVVETQDLLKAAEDWRVDTVPPGFSVAITTPQLLTLAEEWRVS